MKSWKTSTAGFIGGVVIILGELCDLVGVVNQQLGTDGVFTLDKLVLGLSLIGIGAAARDNDKSSEDVGADK